MIGPFIALLSFAVVVGIGLAVLTQLGRYGNLILIGYSTAMTASTFLMAVLHLYFGEILFDAVIWRSVACGCVGFAAAFCFMKLAGKPRNNLAA